MTKENSYFISTKSMYYQENESIFYIIRFQNTTTDI